MVCDNRVWLVNSPTYPHYGSCQFHQHFRSSFFCQYSFAKNFQNQTVIREKQRKTRSNQIFSVNLTPDRESYGNSYESIGNRKSRNKNYHFRPRHRRHPRRIFQRKIRIEPKLRSQTENCLGKNNLAWSYVEQGARENCIYIQLRFF